MTPLAKFKEKIAQLVAPRGYEIVYDQDSSVCYYADIKYQDEYKGSISSEKRTDTWRISIRGRCVATDYDGIPSAMRKLLT